MLTLPSSDFPFQEPLFLCPLPLSERTTHVVVTSDAAVGVTFATYSLLERGSGSKLNLGKCNGLWLGGWSERDAPPLALQWSSARV